MVKPAVADPLRMLGKTRRGYVIPDLKVLYISVSKNACTSMKWLIAEMAGEDLDGFPVRLKPWTTAEEGVHNRGSWKHTPMIWQLDPEVRASISPENGWYVFGIVRDPRPRLFSAWQNKFLLRSPDFAHWRNEPWYPRVPTSSEEIIEDFTMFVDWFVKSREKRITENSHFAPQVTVLSPEIVPYSNVYDITEIPTLVSDLRAHAESMGWKGTLNLRRANDTPLRANAGVFGGDILPKLEKFYADDFALYGDRWDLDRIDKATGWSKEALAQVDIMIAMSERIRELRQIALRTDKRAKQLEERVLELEGGGPSRGSSREKSPFAIWRERRRRDA